MPHIAIIGAGIAGLTLAQQLQQHNTVRVFEKARGVGGRMSTRYAPPYSFDHGSPYFTAKSDAFRQFLEPLVAGTHIAAWNAPTVSLVPGHAPQPYTETETRYVGFPHMNAVCKQLARDIDVHTGTEIAPLTGIGKGWQLTDPSGNSLGAFDYIISTAPAPQTARLFAAVLPADALPPASPMRACHTLMLGLSTPWPHAWSVAHVKESPIGLLTLTNSKPGRDHQATSLVVHATPAWSEAHLEDAPERVEAALLHALKTVIGNVPEQAHAALHRWRYAHAPATLQQGSYLDHTLGLGAAGDWTGEASVEGAWTQAMLLAGRFSADPESRKVDITSTDRA